jgi:hypothetical protein
MQGLSKVGLRCAISYESERAAKRILGLMVQVREWVCQMLVEDHRLNSEQGEVSDPYTNL